MLNVIKVLDSNKLSESIDVKNMCLKHPDASALLLFDHRTERSFTIFYQSDVELKCFEVLRAVKHPQKKLMLTLSRHQPVTLPTSDLLGYVSDQPEWDA